MPEAYEQEQAKIIDIFKENIRDQSSLNELAAQVLRGTDGGMELGVNTEDWIEKFKYHLIWLDKDDSETTY